VLTGLLRDDLGFEGLIVTDAIEMRALAASHSPGEIAVRALAAGADAVCVGVSSPQGESVYALRDHIVAAVRDGSLPEERLAEAASRVFALAAWYAERAPLRAAVAAQAGADQAHAHQADADRAGEGWTGASLGEIAAWAALRVAGPGSRQGDAASARASMGEAGLGGSRDDEIVPDRAMLGEVALHDVASVWVGRPVVAEAPLVVDISARPTQAVGETTRTTLGRALAELLPGTRGVEVAAGGVLPDLREDARPVVIVVHDAARHDWIRRLLADAVRDRPDAVVVETGLPGTPVGAVYLCTHGNSRASARAAARWLAGGGADGPAP
jgi:beta-N-acetylhexosaminidase